MKTKKTWLALLAALAALASGCGSDDKTSESGNATDAAFITDMTAHHQGAIEMAEVAQKHAPARRAVRPRVHRHDGRAPRGRHRDGRKQPGP